MRCVSSPYSFSVWCGFASEKHRPCADRCSRGIIHQDPVLMAISLNMEVFVLDPIGNSFIELRQLIYLVCRDPLTQRYQFIFS